MCVSLKYTSILVYCVINDFTGFFIFIIQLTVPNRVNLLQNNNGAKKNYTLNIFE